jgi:tetratricopeptide (TPR) repeat protein
MMRRYLIALFAFILLSACTGTSGDLLTPTSAPIVIPISVIDTSAADSGTVAPATCADLDASWGSWPAAIDVLNRLIALNMSCGDEPLASKLYAAQFNFGMALEQAGDSAQAIEHYLAAFNLDPRREEALKALALLNALPAPTPSACAPLDPNLAPPPSTAPDSSQFVTVNGNRLMLNGEPFRLHGLNYYPRHTPWDRFLTQADPAEMAAELDLIASAGFNSLRLFLWYQPMFTCQNGQTLPDEAAFGKLDALLALAAQHNLKVILTLNDLPDLYFTPLYTADTTSPLMTAYIVRRYHHNPTILAWDVRNEADLDHGVTFQGRFTTEQVVGWLARESVVIRENDPNHLITAGWWGNPLETEPYVDFLSFHLWDDANKLAEHAAEYQAASGKPILLEETGYATWGEYDEAGQAEFLPRVTQTAEELNLAGWMIWTAFDLQPKPGQPENAEHHFGLWRLDLSPKPVLDLLPLP